MTIEEISDEDEYPSFDPLASDEFTGLLFVPADPNELDHFLKQLTAEQQRFLDARQQCQVQSPELPYTDENGVVWASSDSQEHEADPNVTDWLFDMDSPDGDNSDHNSEASNETDEESTHPDLPDMDGSYSDEEEESSADGNSSTNNRPWAARRAPTIQQAREALKDLNRILRPPRAKGRGYKECTIPLAVRTRLEWMRDFLYLYQDDSSVYGKQHDGRARWTSTSLQAAHNQQSTPHRAKKLRKWSRAYIKDRTAWPIPQNPNDKRLSSRIDDPDVAADIANHLQSIGKYVRALDIVHYLSNSETRSRLQVKKAISLATARRWMNKMGYRWTKRPSGQYIDGHERDDVVYYRQHVYLPVWAQLDRRTRTWSDDNKAILDEAREAGKTVVIWFHDECTFYANDRRIVRWVHKNEKAVPRAKGEGASLMIADFISADYGWLASPDGTDSTRVQLRAGIRRDGYFTNEDIIKHADHAMDILQKHYADEEHILVFDNATTHLKREPDALSARKMPKYTPKPGCNWGVEVPELDEDCHIVHDSHGKPQKMRINMGPAKFADGTRQDLYWPAGHERAGVFKGMAAILEERGFGNMNSTRAECLKFKCDLTKPRCCCRRILYNEPDFVNVPSILEKHCKKRGIQVLFLPKFHPELNFIEQCWGFAKRLYRTYPETSKEADLIDNVLKSLDSVPLSVMRRYDLRLFILWP